MTCVIFTAVTSTAIQDLMMCFLLRIGFAKTVIKLWKKVKRRTINQDQLCALNLWEISQDNRLKSAKHSVWLSKVKLLKAMISLQSRKRTKTTFYHSERQEPPLKKPHNLQQLWLDQKPTKLWILTEIPDLVPPKSYKELRTQQWII